MRHRARLQPIDRIAAGDECRDHRLCTLSNAKTKPLACSVAGSLPTEMTPARSDGVLVAACGMWQTDHRAEQHAEAFATEPDLPEGRLDRAKCVLGRMVNPRETLALEGQWRRRIEARGAIETAHRALQACGQVFRYAIATGRAERDPTPDLRGALKPVLVQHMAAITDPQRVGDLLRAIESYKGMPITRAALQLAPLVFVRPGELRKAEWVEFDLDAAQWRIPAARMKRTKQEKLSGTAHAVPLSRQAVAILRELHPLTGHGRYLFPSPRTSERPMSDNGVLSALRRMGFPSDEMTGHGFRAMARTMLAERLNVDEAIIEAQLAHAVKDSLGRAYNRTEFLEQRRKMLQTWADYLDKLRTGAEIIPIKRSRVRAVGRPPAMDKA